MIGDNSSYKNNLLPYCSSVDSSATSILQLQVWISIEHNTLRLQEEEEVNAIG